jgi:hypothetical protein
MAAHASNRLAQNEGKWVLCPMRNAGVLETVVWQPAFSKACHVCQHEPVRTPRRTALLQPSDMGAEILDIEPRLVESATILEAREQ